MKFKDVPNSYAIINFVLWIVSVIIMILYPDPSLLIIVISIIIVVFYVSKDQLDNQCVINRNVIKIPYIKGLNIENNMWTFILIGDYYSQAFCLTKENIALIEIVSVDDKNFQKQNKMFEDIEIANSILITTPISTSNNIIHIRLKNPLKYQDTADLTQEEGNVNLKDIYFSILNTKKFLKNVGSNIRTFK